MAADEVKLVGPDGKLYYVAKDDAQRAVAEEGYQQPGQEDLAEFGNREKYGQGLGNELRAGAEGAVRGALAIGADTLLSQFEDPEGIRERKERNPIAANVGMAGGLAAGALATGGENLASKAVGGSVGFISKMGGLAEHLAARALGEGGTSLASRVAAKGLAKGAGSAVEGAFYGLGEAVSEDALGEHDMTAQRVLAHMGMGAVFAGGVGTGLAGLGELAGPMAGKAVDAIQAKIADSPALQAKLEEISGERALMAAGVSKKYYKKLLSSDVKGLEGTALEGEDLTLFDEAARIMREEHIVKAGDTPENVAEKLKTKLTNVREGLQTFTSDLDSAAEMHGMPRFDPKEYADTIRRELMEPIADMPMKKATHNKLAEVANEYDEIGAKHGELSFTDAEAHKRSFDNAFKLGETDTNNAMRQARGILNAQIEAKAKPIAETLGSEAYSGWKSLKRDYQALNIVEKASADRSAAILTNRKISPSDYGTGIAAAALMGGHPLGALTSLGAALTHKVIREHGNAVISDMANRVSKLAFLEKASQDVSNRISSGIDSFVSSIGKAGKLVAPASVGALHDPIFGEGEKNRADGKAARQDAFKARLSELSQIVANPEAAAKKLNQTMGVLQSAAPKVAMLLGTRAVAAAHFLFDKAPKAPDTGGMLAGHREWHPTDAEISKWERYVHAVRDPSSVLEDLKHGHISAEAAEALKVVYPKIFQDIATQLVPKLASRPDVPFSVRMQLSTLFGAPVDSLAKPSFTAAMQQVHKAAQVSTGPAKQPAVGGKSAILRSTQTPFQRAIDDRS